MVGIGRDEPLFLIGHQCSAGSSIFIKTLPRISSHSVEPTVYRLEILLIIEIEVEQQIPFELPQPFVLSQPCFFILLVSKRRVGSHEIMLNTMRDIVS